MDITDKKILGLLAQNAMTTSTEIGTAVNLSIPAVNKRILKLQENGTIRTFTVLTDPQKCEKSICAFIMVTIRYGEGVNSLLQYIQSDPDVLECHAVTGDYDYILKLCAKDVTSLEEKLLHIKRHKGVLKSHTMLSLMEHKFAPTILPDKED